MKKEKKIKDLTLEEYNQICINNPNCHKCPLELFCLDTDAGRKVPSDYQYTDQWNETIKYE